MYEKEIDQVFFHITYVVKPSDRIPLLKKYMCKQTNHDASASDPIATTLLTNHLAPRTLTNSAQKYFLSFHTVFILNENIKWLEEFIVYYRHIGFEHFYLYDNEGSTGGDGTSANNKYGFTITTDTQADDRGQLRKLLEKYGDYITYVKWQPRNEKGQIEYGQNKAITDFIQKYGNETTWVAFMDLDEFLFSEENINIPNMLSGLDPSVSNIRLAQKKFLDRFLTRERYITQEFGCIKDLQVGIEWDWAPKNIVRCKDFKSLFNVHLIHVTNKTFIIEPAKLRFNHYNVNPSGLKWLTAHFKRTAPFEINGLDMGMVRYKELFEPAILYRNNIVDLSKT
jgi:hypothetical protein